MKYSFYKWWTVFTTPKFQRTIPYSSLRNVSTAPTPTCCLSGGRQPLTPSPGTPPPPPTRPTPVTSDNDVFISSTLQFLSLISPPSGPGQSLPRHSQLTMNETWPDQTLWGWTTLKSVVLGNSRFNVLPNYEEEICCGRFQRGLDFLWVNLA